ncbi:Crp/Fnr family transcriptional regulator [Foetidibacter luteolus]|uniref:Crp/Fnr family transcriptional regulator n=1 Tax=Foetidibacter luteolus TaxID=2608880 RepID=UPI00129BDD24|nr:Crp/Fnr family transcriptional regulator [Foetidibacter luteolus]
MTSTRIFPINKWSIQKEQSHTSFSKDEIDLLVANGKHQVYQKNDVIFRQDHYTEGAYLIIKGKVKKFKLDQDKKPHIIFVANSGQLIGYHGLYTGERYVDSAIALEETVVSYIPRQAFFATIDNSPSISRKLLAIMAHQFEILTNSLSLLSRKTVRERLALQLLVMREKYKENHREGEQIQINLSRDDLSSLVGTARENIVRALTEFKKEQTLFTKGRKIVITDVERLIQIANIR